jgi:hypothetical protein
MFKAGELSSLDFKSFSILRPLVRLRGRNGGLSLAIGLRASCAIGAKVVSLKSTLSTFWVFSVFSVIWPDWFALYMQGRFRWVIGLPIYMQWPLARFLRLLSYFRLSSFNLI